MRNHVRNLILVAACCSMGCDDGENWPEFAFTGVVLDTDGKPVRAANVAVLWETEAQEALKALDYIGSRLASTTEYCLDIRDHCGEVVRKLTYDTQPTWDGRDSAGSRMPPGLYHASFWDCRSDSSRTEVLVFLKLESPSELITADQKPLKVTDAAGGFGVRYCENVAGEVIEGTNGPHTISDSITVVAWNDSRWGATSAKVVWGQSHVLVTLENERDGN